MSTLILTQNEKNVLQEFIEVVTNQGRITFNAESSCWFGSGGSDDGGCSDCTAHCANDCTACCEDACKFMCGYDCTHSCESICDETGCGGCCEASAALFSTEKE